MHADFKIRNDLRAGFFGDFGGVANMIVVAVGEHDVGCPLGRFIDAAREFRVAAQERIDENDGTGNLDAESGMAEPGKLHAGLRKGLAMRGERRDIARSWQSTKGG